MIETLHLHKSFGTANALNDVSLTFPDGCFTAVLGQSGSGKSTLFRCVLGLVKPDSGSIRVGGLLMNGDRKELQRIRVQIAPVFQGFQLVKRLSALSNVLIGRLPFSPVWQTVFRNFTKADKDWASHCLERVGLASKLHQRTDTLSGGEQQRVAIARGLAQRAKIFYADEPISNLDPQLGLQILELLNDINTKDSVTVVCNLHQVELAKQFSTMMIGLRQGQLVFAKPTSSVSDADIQTLYQV
jgi:phosphonate transport system ATP-binding protein